MAAPLSMDLRVRIIRLVEAGSSIRRAAERYEVGPSAAIKLMQRVRDRQRHTRPPGRSSPSAARAPRSSFARAGRDETWHHAG